MGAEPQGPERVLPGPGRRLEQRKEGRGWGCHALISSLTLFTQCRYSIPWEQQEAPAP